MIGLPNDCYRHQLSSVRTPAGGTFEEVSTCVCNRPQGEIEPILLGLRLNLQKVKLLSVRRVEADEAGAHAGKD